MEKNGITVILPVHEINDELKKYFTIAVNSIKTQIVLPDELLIVIKPDENIKEFVNGFDYSEMKPFADGKIISSVSITDRVRIVENTTGNYDFASQINFGVSQVNTEWISYLEMDDEISKIWIKCAIKYRSIYPDVDIFLPIIFDSDVNNNYLGSSNEACWATDFGDECGLWDNARLLTWQRINFDGMIMRKEKYEEIGGIKTKIKLVAMWEFFLRASYRSCVIMTVPKVGYKHINQRPGSLFYNLNKEMTQEESGYWLNIAKKEYFHITDRDIPLFLKEPSV